MDVATLLLGFLAIMAVILLIITCRIMSTVDRIYALGTGLGEAPAKVERMTAGPAGPAPRQPNPAGCSASTVSPPSDNVPRAPSPSPSPSPSNDAGDRLVLYYTEWCGASQQFKPVWSRFITDAKPSVRCTAIDCDKDDKVCRDNQIKGYPTVILHKADGRNIAFTGARTVESLNDFVKRNC